MDKNLQKEWGDPRLQKTNQHQTIGVVKNYNASTRTVTFRFSLDDIVASLDERAFCPDCEFKLREVIGILLKIKKEEVAK